MSGFDDDDDAEDISSKAAKKQTNKKNDKDINNANKTLLFQKFASLWFDVILNITHHFFFIVLFFIHHHFCLLLALETAFELFHIFFWSDIFLAIWYDC